MSSAMINVASAVVAGLNDGEFSQELTAERKYQPAVELKDLKTLHVTIVPKSQTITPASRSDSDFDSTIDIGIQKKLDSADADELDALMTLVEEVVDCLRSIRPVGAAFVAIENEPVFDPDHLDTQRVFTSLLTVTYRVRR